MYHASVAIPGPTDFHVSMHGDGQERIRTIRIGETTAGCTVHIGDRAVLDALQAALDEIRADMDAAAQTASDQVPTVMADWPAGPPGELVEVFGK